MSDIASDPGPWYCSWRNEGGKACPWCGKLHRVYVSQQSIDEEGTGEDSPQQGEKS